MNSFALPCAAIALLAVACGSGHEPTYDLDSFDQVANPDGNDPCAGYEQGPLDGDSLTTWINKDPGRQLSAFYAPSDLINLHATLLIPGRSGKLRNEAHEALQAMLTFAETSDLTLRVRSAYRSYVEQCITFNAKVQQHGLEHAKRYSALPGRSQHQLGTTVDITSESLDYQLLDSMEGTPEGDWLLQEAASFGFARSYPQGLEQLTGYASEPWHYRYIGLEAAAEMTHLELPLETYLEECNTEGTALLCGRGPGSPEPEL